MLGGFGSQLTGARSERGAKSRTKSGGSGAGAARESFSHGP